MALSFCSLSSGSSGNCYYIGNGMHGILVDAGISATSIRKFLKELGISTQSLMGVLITHNHTDHIKGLEVLVRRNKMPVFTTLKIKESILSPHVDISPSGIKEIPMQRKFHLAGFEIEAFAVSHDAPETIGFRISSEGQSITIATDLGYISEPVGRYMKGSNVLVIESNYDEKMLTEGSYPHYLKSRIRSDKGHLANHQASGFLAENISDSHVHICLAHLSRNNNTSDLALETLTKTLTEKGIQLNGKPKIWVLDRYKPSAMITL